MQDFTQSPLANSYIINPPVMEGVWKHVRIPVRRVYDFWNITDGYEKVAGNALDAGSFGWQAEIIRSTVELVEDVNFKWIKRNGTDYTDYFEFAITAGMEGNFILGVHRFTDAGRTLLDDVFLWSWHMWVTDYNPSATISLLTPEVDGDGNEARYVYDVLGGQVNRYTGAMWKTGGALDNGFHLFLYCIQVFATEGSEVEVVEKAIIRSRANGNLCLGEEVLHSLGHDVSRGVAQHREALLIGCIEQFNVAIGGDGSSEIDQCGLVVNLSRTIIVQTIRVYHLDDVDNGARLLQRHLAKVFDIYFHCCFSFINKLLSRSSVINAICKDTNKSRHNK